MFYQKGFGSPCCTVNCDCGVQKILPLAKLSFARRTKALL
jgi:hypothetical protein